MTPEQLAIKNVGKQVISPFVSFSVTIILFANSVLSIQHRLLISLRYYKALIHQYISFSVCAGSQTAFGRACRCSHDI